ncbi:hypothetical protein Desca_1655 [Desulfotomaculum nigrificans CO-1-SRB]|uniref:Uncharacterized protein n=1 Tax=Desulfotomaculum nigrificans (strain DSM 14880 / VKM B-2319 / CO-1-SRB) TaxID=868595 RepID=F6B778_DESCC|nr:hypothetical protein [Desulfotomaculum nigrificans]AEF94503.1 hypothetical protein Desca_1655 [Desulfotomaculum nigrificans CO-1-SRB]
MLNKVKKGANLTSILELVVLQKIHDSQVKIEKKSKPEDSKLEIFCDDFGQMVYWIEPQNR